MLIESFHQGKQIQDIVIINVVNINKQFVVSNSSNVQNLFYK